MRHAVFATLGRVPRIRVLAALAIATSLAGPIAPAAAQKPSTEVRVDRIEKELRAVQRKVFPTGTPIEAEISRPAAPTPSGAGASSPVADLTARVNALESQLATITGQVEQNSYKIKQLEETFGKYKAETEARLLQPDTPASQPTQSTADTVVETKPTPPAVKPTPAKPVPAATTGPVSEARKSAVAAIEKPDTGDAANDAYTYGYRLWDAKFYPEAQAQLKATVDQFGSASIASRTQNLLGRAYLDDGKPALASVAFYENYQKRPRGDRAPDSLTYLGEALIQLKKPADACKVYAELEQVYGETLSASLRGIMDKGKAKAKCS